MINQNVYFQKLDRLKTLAKQLQDERKVLKINTSTSSSTLVSLLMMMKQENYIERHTDPTSS